MTALLGLVAAPWDHRTYAVRTQRVVDRYEHLLAMALAPEGPTQRRGTVQLLLRHPGALSESEQSTGEGLARRRDAAQAELQALSQAALLPPAPEDAPRVRVLALADLTWMVLELRVLRRLRRRYRQPETLCVAYRAEDRADPLPLRGAELWAAAQVPGAQVKREALSALALRYGRPDLPAWLLPRAQGPCIEPLDVAASAEVRPGRPKRVEAYGRTLALFRHEGEVHALDDTCPHRGGSLGKGEVDPCGTVLCPLHAWAFDLKTGCYVDNPNLRVQTYRVQEREGRVFLLGSKEQDGLR